MGTPGRITHDMARVNNSLSPEMESPDGFQFVVNAHLENIALRVTDQKLRDTTNHHRLALDNREKKVLVMERWLEAVLTVRALGLYCDEESAVRERLHAETARRDYLRIAVAGLEKELARRQGKEAQA